MLLYLDTAFIIVYPGSLYAALTSRINRLYYFTLDALLEVTLVYVVLAIGERQGRCWGKDGLHGIGERAGHHYTVRSYLHLMEGSQYQYH